MNLLKRFCLLACAFSCSLIVFSSGSIDASAALLDGQYIDAEDFRTYIGDTIRVTFWNGTRYETTDAYYNGTNTIGTVNSENSYESVYNGAPTLRYRASHVTVNSSMNYVQVEFDCPFSVVDTTQLHTSISVSYSSNTNISTAYTSPSWSWTGYHFENRDESSVNSGTYAAWIKNGRRNAFVPVDITETVPFTTSSISATFYGITMSNNDLDINIGIPYISTGGSVQSGGASQTTTTTTPTSGDINVSVDMSETNGLLGGIQSTLSGLVSGIGNLFTPTENFVTSWKTNITNLFYEVFQPYEGAKELLDNFANDLFSYGAAETVEFPAVSVPGTSFSIPARSVPLKPAGMESTFSIIRIGFNILATCAFINLIMTRVKAFLVGEKVVEVEGADDIVD